MCRTTSIYYGAKSTYNCNAASLQLDLSQATVLSAVLHTRGLLMEDIMMEKNGGSGKISRRTILRGAAMTAGAIPILLAGVSTAHAKATQKDVGYQDKPNGQQTCANCRSFEPPSGCKTVEGSVSPEGWCKIYIKKA